MENLTGFLGKFQKLLSEKNKKEEVVCDVLKGILGARIDPKNISIKNFTLTVNTSAANKSAIFMKKEKVIKVVNKQLGKTIITDVR